MFEFGRDLRRMLQPKVPFAPTREGLTGGDPSLLELLDVDLLKAEAKASDVAAGRISAKDRPALNLRQAVVWRELARRTGEPEALRKAAAAAETALKAISRQSRPQAWARARLEQAHCALLGAELFGDHGLSAAADFALAEAAGVARRGPIAADAEAARARIGAAACEAAAVPALIDRSERALTVLEAPVRGRAGPQPAIQARADRGEMLLAAGERLHDERLIDLALADFAKASAALDPAYEPVSFARVASLRGQAMVALGESRAEAKIIAEGVAVIASQFEQLDRDHSPLDWARGQLALARGLQALGEAADSAEAFEQAQLAYDRALVVLRRRPALGLCAVAGVNRALCLARSAERSGDLFTLDAAEAAMRCELAAAEPSRDPVPWAVCQLALARLYETRVHLTGRDEGRRAKAAMAFSAALDVFAEQGLRSLSDVAAEGLGRLKRL